MKYFSNSNLYSITRHSSIAATLLLLASCGGGSDDSASGNTGTEMQAGYGTVTAEAKALRSTAACNATAWEAGKYYSAGSIVNYSANGKYYRASHNNPGYDPTISTWYWDVYSCGTSSNMTSTISTTTTTSSAPVAATTTSASTTTSNPATVAGSSIVSEAQFNKMFPNRNSFYTYAGFVAAIDSYPGIFSLGSDTLRKQEAAAFLANVNHETGGLQYIREANQANWPLYCASSRQYPCAPNQQYYGRGPMQLSWNYNYGAAGAALGLNLLADPDLVARDSTVAWRTAMWFWMTQKGGAQMTPHDAMVNLVGFAETIRAINGGLECNQAPGTIGNTEMLSRVNYYKNFTQLLGVPSGNNLSC